MKRCLTILSALLLLLGCFSAASAEPVIPEEIRQYFADHGLGDAAVTATAQLSGHGNNDCCFVLIRTAKSVNILYCFKEKTGEGWVHSFHTDAAVPQGKNAVTIYLADSMNDWATDKTYKGPLLMIGQYDEYGEQIMLFTAYQLSSSGKWNIRRIWSYVGYDSMELSDGKITYYKSLESSQEAGTAYGTYQRDLRYLSLSSIPKTLKAARERLTSAPAIPASSELAAQEVQFTGGKKYNVYSAPDSRSMRGGNGKAAVSTNGWIQVFGREEDWILIQYSIDSQHYRFGYISAKSLPKKASVPELRFNQAPAQTAVSVNVTDDPLYSRSVLTTLPTGTDVTWLASMGEWAYIEYRDCRGFVPTTSLVFGQTVPTQQAFYTYVAGDGKEYPLFEITRMYEDVNHHVYAVAGRFERIEEDADGIPYGVYADGGAIRVYTFASDFSASMLGSMTSDDLNNMPVPDLYQWYVQCYLEGAVPENGLTYLYDLPEEQRESANVSFWFVTTRIELNRNNEIRHMEYEYVPWG